MWNALFARLDDELHLTRCPHCGIDLPSLRAVSEHRTTNYRGENARLWRIYVCARCGGVVSACARSAGDAIDAHYPRLEQLDEAIPRRVRSYLEQALESRHAPAGAVMLTASAVDAMLRAKGLLDGSLYLRISEAANRHLITPEMARWAHEVRLEANDQRHADDVADLPDSDDAQRCLDFALTLAQFMFVLPSRVQRGLDGAISDPPIEATS